MKGSSNPNTRCVNSSAASCAWDSAKACATEQLKSERAMVVGGENSGKAAHQSQMYENTGGAQLLSVSKDSGTFHPYLKQTGSWFGLLQIA